MRIIPACAGQTPEHAPRAFRDPDHPRLCGANHAHVAGALRSLGSSPLVRGKPRMRCARLAGRRIIPACAGQTILFDEFESSLPDHPRLCGANCVERVRFTHSSGSSPLVRGKLRPAVPVHAPRRIIPACAGQTLLNLVRHCSLPGSSPLVRGKLDCRFLAGFTCRIIPACAGQTSTSLAPSSACADHPRLCGANLLADVRRHHTPDHPRLCGANRSRSDGLSDAHGSSPLVRGKHVAVAVFGELSGIIPACAGQTPMRANGLASASDHPRLCGANKTCIPTRMWRNGSSPLVRGKPIRCHQP